MRTSPALISALLTLLLALPSAASAADRTLGVTPLDDLLYVMLGIEAQGASDPSGTPGDEGEEGAGGSDETDGTATSDDDDGDGASSDGDGFADTDSSTQTTNGSLGSNSNYGNGSTETSQETTNLGNGDEGGADDPSARGNALLRLRDWAIGIIFGQDRPWADRKAKRRG